MMHIYFVSLGCDKNLVDSEKMLALLTKEGYELTDEPEQAEIIVVNTCAFIHDAKQESIETLLELAEYKKTGKCKVLIASGCLAERYQDTILEEMPEIDGVIGTTAYDDIAVVVKKALGGEHAALTKELDYLPVHLTDRVTSGMSHVGYLKISEGCNKNCTYCIIPSMRGHYRSVPMEDLIEEAEKLAEKGIRELILVAQETTLYGVDLYHEKKLPELLRRLSEIRDISWIRVLYCYPEEITVELAQELRENPKVKMLRKEIPDIALRTTLISGFPGETNEQHEECIEFVREMKFDRLGVFPYSEEEGTKAADYPEQIDMEIRRRWADEIMEAQQEVIFAQNETLVGKTYKAIVDGYLPQDNVYVARTYRDTPEIDGCIFFQVPYEIVSGTIVTLLVTDAKGYDLIGEICSEEDDE